MTSHDGTGNESIEAGRRAAEEAIRLLQTLTEFTGAHDAPECRICPVCQLLAALRRVRPEAVEHLVRASAELASALRDLAAPTPSGAAAGEPPGSDGAAPSGPSEPSEPSEPSGPFGPTQPTASEPIGTESRPTVPAWPAPVPARLRVQRIDVTD